MSSIFIHGVKALAGYAAGNGAVRVMQYFNPAFALNPRAFGIAALVGAVSYSILNNKSSDLFKMGNLHFKKHYDLIQWATMAGASLLVHQAFKNSYKLTRSQSLMGVFIGAGAKIGIDFLFRSKDEKRSDHTRL